VSPSRIGRRLLVLALLLTASSSAAHAQVDLQGTWRPLPRNQDGSGMIGDYAGVPLSPAGLWRGETWSPDDYDIAEWACRPHAWDYSLEGPLSAI
jgi:hypothetical protein